METLTNAFNSLKKENDISDGEQEYERVNPNGNINRSKFCTRLTYDCEDRINATIALETIRTLNGQDNVGVEDFVKSVKRARMKTSQPNLLLDLIIAKKIQGLAEKAIRYQQINSYDDLYEALRQNLRQNSKRNKLCHPITIHKSD